MTQPARQSQLTTSLVRRWVRFALKDKGFRSAKVVSVNWLGQRCAYRSGPGHFRIARVVIDVNGRRLNKNATVDTLGGFQIQ